MPQNALTGYHSGSVLAMEDDLQGQNGAVAIDMNGAVQSYMQVHWRSVMWIRIRSDPDSFGSVDPDPDSESGSGSRGIKSLIK